MASDPDKLKRTAVARANDAATAALRAEIDKKASLINSHHEETVFDADRHVKDATEQYYEEISLEGDQFLRMDGEYVSSSCFRSVRCFSDGMVV